MRAVLDTERAAVRALLPQVESARKANDQRRFDGLMGELATHWDTMREAYLASAVNPVINARMDKFIESMESAGHDMHRH